MTKPKDQIHNNRVDYFGQKIRAGLYATYIPPYSRGRTALTTGLVLGFDHGYVQIENLERGVRDVHNKRYNSVIMCPSYVQTALRDGAGEADYEGFNPLT